ncbi:MAG TPA: GNAT family N-acetyltransferase [Thermoplasmata archaeon]|nr:GNAT family N-acetyltransferase [Thermoplasmata archaeon]
MAEMLPPGVETRELRHADLPSFEPVILSGIGTLERAIGLDQTAAPMLRSLRRPGIWILFRLFRALGRAIRILVRVEQGRVVGTVSVIPRKTVGVIVGVATDPSARGRGIATQLLEAAHRLVRAKGIPRLALDVDTDNETALRVYRRLGYQEVARFAWFVGAPPSEADPNPTELRTVPRSQLRPLLPWIDAHRPPEVRAPYPATPRRLSHLEMLFSLPGTTWRTWQLSRAEGPVAVVRAAYSRMNTTAYLIPAAWDPSLPSEAYRGLLLPGIAWARSVGANRIACAVPDPPGPWEPALGALGLGRSASSTMMTRPTGP